MELTSLAPLAQPPAEVEVDKNDKKAVAKQFEKVFTKLLVSEVHKSLANSSMFSGPTLEAFDGVFQEALADSLTAGRGLGLSKHILTQLEHQHQPTVLPSDFRNEVKPGGLPTEGRVSSAYGWRSDPIHGKRAHHSGMDIAAPQGSPIRSVRDGRVVFAGERGGYGNVVIVDHGDGLQTRYAHCSELKVAKGQRVQAGEIVGSVGHTGRATGDQLHFEAQKNGISIDPMEIVNRKL